MSVLQMSAVSRYTRVGKLAMNCREMIDTLHESYVSSIRAVFFVKIFPEGMSHCFT